MSEENESPKVPKGYTAEELDRDSPFNAWLRNGPPECDCLNDCGDDMDVGNGTLPGCQAYRDRLTEAQAQVEKLRATGRDAARWRVWAEAMSAASQDGAMPPFLDALEEIVPDQPVRFTVEQFNEWIDLAMERTRV